LFASALIVFVRPVAASFASKPGVKQYWLTKMGYDTFMPLETQEDIMSEEAMYEVRKTPSSL
jgi:hypothetical protein